jgi:hypothetical protein
LVVVALLVYPRTHANDGQPLLAMPAAPPTPTIGPAPLAIAHPRNAAAPLFQATFDDAHALADWHFSTDGSDLADDQANWRVDDGTLMQDRAGRDLHPLAATTVAVAGDATWTDYTVSASTYAELNPTWSLVARWSADGYYRFRLVATAAPDAPKLALERVQGAHVTPLAVADTGGFALRQWATASLAVHGDTLVATLDGQPLLAARDGVLTHGMAGVGTLALGGIHFDTVQVTR